MFLDLQYNNICRATQTWRLLSLRCVAVFTYVQKKHTHTQADDAAKADEEALQAEAEEQESKEAAAKAKAAKVAKEAKAKKAIAELSEGMPDFEDFVPPTTAARIQVTSSSSSSSSSPSIAKPASKGTSQG